MIKKFKSIDNASANVRVILELPLCEKTEGAVAYLKKARSFFIFVILVFNIQVCFSQQSIYQYYEISKIYSNEVIKGISKDEKGFVWLATDNGVLQFDGNTTTLC